MLTNIRRPGVAEPQLALSRSGRQPCAQGRGAHCQVVGSRLPEGHAKGFSPESPMLPRNVDTELRGTNLRSYIQGCGCPQALPTYPGDRLGQRRQVLLGLPSR